MTGGGGSDKLRGMKARAGYPVRKITLAEEGRDSMVSALSPAARVAMVWELTVQAWTFKDGSWHEPRLRRDVVRTLRGGR